MSKDLKLEGDCEPCREERGLDKGERRFSGKCNICGDSFALLWRDAPDSLRAERRRELQRPILEAHTHAFRIDPSIEDMSFVEAHSLKAGDRFSYLGSHKIYEAQSDAKSDESYDGKVRLVVTHNQMVIRIDQYAVCWIHGNNESKEAK